MTTQATLSGNVSLNAAALSSQEFEAFVVVASDGRERVLHREGRSAPTTDKPCVVYEVAPVARQASRASFAEFDRLASELADEARANEGLNRAIAEGRKWVAESYYLGEPTLASLRLSAGMSQRELGERCNLAQPHISRYESGRLEPLVSTAEALAAALGVSLEKFAKALKNTRERAAAVEESA